MDLERVFTGRPSRAQTTGPTVVEGRVHEVRPDGAMFIVPDWDSGRHVFGPAPWPAARVEVADAHDHPHTPPPVGARCLVLFVGSGIDRPWILNWWPI